MKIYKIILLMLLVMPIAMAVLPKEEFLVDYLSFGDLGKSYLQTDIKNVTITVNGNTQVLKNTVRGNLSLSTANSQYIRYPKGNISNLTVYTYNYWENFTNSADVPCFFSSTTPGLYWYIDGSQKFYFEDEAAHVVTSSTPNTKMMLTMTANASGTDFYKDGAFVFHDNTHVYLEFKNNFMQFAGCGGGQAPIGYIDEIGIWNVTLNASAISLLYNGGNGLFYSPSGVSPVLDLKIYNNKTAPYTEYTSIAEQDLFYFYANYTLSGAGIAGASCSVNASNITAVFLKYSNINFTIHNTTWQESLVLTENSSNLIYDIYRLRLCYPQLAVGADVYINSALYKTYASGAILPCSSGYTEINEIVYAYNYTKNINLSVGCSGCNNVNRKLNLVTTRNSTTSNYTMAYLRDFNKHSENMYEKSAGNYYYDKYPYTFIGNQTREIRLYCNDNEDINSYTPTGRKLKGEIILINGASFQNNSLIEQTFAINITAALYDDIVSAISFNLTYSNGTFIKSSDTTYLQVLSSDAGANSIYNLTLWAKSIDDYISITRGYFWINDTIPPAITWFAPASAASFEDDTEQAFSAEAYDIDLYAFNATIYFTVNNTMLYSTEIKGISPPLYKWNLTRKYDNGIYNITIITVDSHTDAAISDMDISKTADKLIFDNRIKIYAPAAIDAETVKSTDRYSFQFTYPKDIEQKIFYVTSNEKLVYLKDSRYIAHIIDYANLKWIDFEGAGKNPLVERINDTDYRITFYDDAEKVTFNSIGGLNRAEESRIFTVEDTGAYTEDLIRFTNWFNFDILDLSTTAGALVFFFLLILLMFMIVVSFYTQVPVMFILSGIYCLFLSIFIMAILSSIIGVIMLLLAAVLIFFSIIYMRD